MIILTTLKILFFLQGLSDLDQRPLSFIDQKLIDIGSYLSEFRDEQKVHCLKVFVECMDFVKWIRSCTNGMGLMESKEHKLNEMKLFQGKLILYTQTLSMPR